MTTLVPLCVFYALYSGISYSLQYSSVNKITSASNFYFCAFSGLTCGTVLSNPRCLQVFDILDNRRY